MVKILQIIKEKFYELRDIDDEHDYDQKNQHYHQEANLEEILENAKK